MKGKRIKCLGLALCCMASSLFVCGCGASANDGKVEIEIVQYKPEAANYFKTVEDEFNATHDDIHLKISSPNDAMTILKTRFIREDYPDIIGIGGDINYSYFVDAEILADISDYSGLAGGGAVRAVDGGLPLCLLHLSPAKAGYFSGPGDGTDGALRTGEEVPERDFDVAGHGNFPVSSIFSRNFLENAGKSGKIKVK